MNTTLRDILNRCPTHGHLTDTAHAAFCSNQDHIDLLKLIDHFEGDCDCPSEMEICCPECDYEFRVDVDDQ